MPPVVPYAISPVATDTLYQATVLHSCLEGYWFSVGLFQQNLTCSASGLWWPENVQCSGEYACTSYLTVHVVSYAPPPPYTHQSLIISFLR